jgi:hypothetical protein
MRNKLITLSKVLNYETFIAVAAELGRVGYYGTDDECVELVRTMRRVLCEEGVVNVGEPITGENAPKEDVDEIL